MSFSCASCSKPCRTHDLSKLPGGHCPTKEFSEEKFLGLYDETDLQIAHNAALVESAGYCRDTRLEDTMSFAWRMGYKKLGLAFCTGFSNEAKILVNILTENGFEVEAACCKCGSISKEHIGIDQEHQVRPGFEAMCNPAGQAEYLCSKDVDLCIVMGLCVGHDTLFIRHCTKPCTVFVAKDRVLAHNPAAALYTADSYMKRLHTFIKDRYENG